MKQKKTAKKPDPASSAAVTPAPAAEAAAVQGGETLGRWKRLEAALFFVAVFFAITITTARMSLILLALCLAFSLRKSSVEALREHLSLPVVGIVCMLLLYGVSAVSIQQGTASVLEFFRGLCVFSVAGFALLRFRKQHLPALLWGFVIVAAVFAFITLDGAALGAIYRPAAAAINALGGDMSQTVPVESGRLNGLFNNANASAGMLALAMLPGLYLMQTEQKKSMRFAAALLLGVTGVTFWLHVSRGAILSFGASLVVWLLFTKKGERARLFLLLAVSAMSVLVCGFGAQRFIGAGSLLPDLLGLLCGPVAFALDLLVAGPAARLLEGREKLLKIGAVSLGGVCIAAVAAALLIRGPFTVTAETPLVRVVDLKPGETYTVSGDWDGALNMTVYVEGKDDLLMDRYENLYAGPAGEAAFTVPADTAVTRVWVSGEGEVRDITFSDGTKVTLDYVLLPASLEGSLQDPLLKSSSFLLRVQYVKDALKIWKEAPLFGRGLASSDTWYAAVQPFFYQSQFVHNHLVQYLTNLGIVGLAAFLLAAGGAIWLLLRRRKEDSGFAAAMLAAMTAMHLHSLMEINFSIRAYAVMAYLLLAIVTIGCADPFPIRGRDGLKRTAAVTAVAYWLILGIFGGIALSYRIVNRMAAEFETQDYESYMSMLDKYIRMDALDDAYYKLLYAAEGAGDPHYGEKAYQYAMELRETGLYTNCDGVARYYYLPLGMLDEVFPCFLEGIAQKANDPEAWDGEVEFCRTTLLTGYSAAWEEAMEPYLEGVMRIRDALLAFNAGQMIPVELTETNQAFLDAVEMVWRDGEMDPQSAYLLLSRYSEE